MASGNDKDDVDDAVDDPAQSYHTVGVGGYSGGCSGGKEHSLGSYDGSQYGTIAYHSSGLTYCSWCYDGGRDSKFTPDVYSAYMFHANSDKEEQPLGGTSFAAPVVGAGTAIDASANSGDAYSARLDKYHYMNQYTICPSDTAELGGVLYAPDLE